MNCEQTTFSLFGLAIVPHNLEVEELESRPTLYPNTDPVMSKNADIQHDLLKILDTFSPK